MKLDPASWTPHALVQVAERSLTRELVEAVVRAPDRVDDVRPGRVVATAGAEIDGKLYLVRVVIDVDRQPFEIVTAYRTSRIRKYGGSP